MAKTSTSETPFALAYGSEAVIPIEVGLPSHRMKNFNIGNNRVLQKSLDLLKEIRTDTKERVAANKRKIEQYFNKRVKLRLQGG